MAPSSSIHDLKTLVLSFHPVIVIETVEEDRARGLLRAVADQVRATMFEWSLTRGLARSGETTAIFQTSDPYQLLRHLEGLNIYGMYLLKDFARHLEDFKVCRQFRETAGTFWKNRSTMILTGEAIRLPEEIECEAVRYDLQLPRRDELLKVVTSVLQSLPSCKATPPKLGGPDREDLLRALNGMTLHQARQAVAAAALANCQLTPESIRTILDRKAQAIREGGLMEYYPGKDNKYELGGFANLKAWLQRAYQGFSPEAKELNLAAPRGILIVGVPGCGKSLAAKFISREWRLPLLKLDAGRLLDKFVGESEKNFRKAVTMAESMAPVVLWIDEIEKGMVASGSGEGDGGLSRRLFGAFLTWLQEKKQDVFVVATANDLSILPPELLRKGRFDEIFFVDLPTEQEREAIFKIQLKLRKQAASAFDLPRIVAASDGFSGAEIEQAVVASLYRALAQKKPLDTGLLLEELQHTVPLSVSRREDIARLRETASGRFVSVR